MDAWSAPRTGRWRVKLRQWAIVGRLPAAVGFRPGDGAWRARRLRGSPDVDALHKAILRAPAAATRTHAPGWQREVSVRITLSGRALDPSCLAAAGKGRTTARTSRMHASRKTRKCESSGPALAAGTVPHTNQHIGGCECGYGAHGRAFIGFHKGPAAPACAG